MELLVVVAIIATLVAILVPAVRSALEQGRRAACAANLGGAGRALTLYASQNNHQYPYLPLNGAGWGVAIGANRTIDPAGGASNGRNPTATLFMLVRGNFCAVDSFVCPSSGEVGRTEAGTPWDFANGTSVSYAIMNPYGPRRRFSADAIATVPLAADASPYFDAATGLRNSLAAIDLDGAAEVDVRRANSPNHNGEGQNVMLNGGSARWARRADSGHGLDNIYTRADDPSGVDAGGSLPAAANDGAGLDQGPAGELDAYLMP